MNRWFTVIVSLRERGTTDTGGSLRLTASRTLTELLIDCEEDRTLRAVLVGMLREVDRNA